MYQPDENLINAIKEKKLIIWFGSGYALHLGFPKWDGLVTEAIDLVYKNDVTGTAEKLKNEIKPGTELTVLEKLSDNKTEILNYFAGKFKIRFNNDDTKLHPYKRLKQISSKFISTNYDMAFECANPEIPKVLYYNNWQLQELRKNNKYFFKLHGCAEDNAQNCIVFTDQFNELYKIIVDEKDKQVKENEETAAKFLLKSLIAQHSILFIGFGLSDPYTNYIFDNTEQLLGGTGCKHYRISLKGEEIDKPFLSSIAIDSYNEIPVLLYKLSQYNINPKLSPGGIIAPLNKFIGRVDESKMLIDFFRNEQEHFFFLWGLGGMGKTKIVYEIQNKIHNKPYYIKCVEATDIYSVADDLGLGFMDETENSEGVNNQFIERFKEKGYTVIFDDYYNLIDSVFKKTLLALRRINNGKAMIISRTLSTSLSGLGGAIPNLKIGVLNDDDFKDFVESFFKIRYNKIPGESVVKRINEIAKGYPLAGELLCSLAENNPAVFFDDNIVGNFDEDDDKYQEFISRLLGELIERGTEQEKNLLFAFSMYEEAVTLKAIKALPHYDANVLTTLSERKSYISNDGGIYFLHPLVHGIIKKMAGDNIDAYRSIARYYENIFVASLLEDMQSYEKASYYYLKTSPNDVRQFKERQYRYFNHENVKALISKSFETTIKKFITRIKLDENDLPAYNELGMAYRNNNQLEESINVLEKAVAKAHIQSYNELGISYRENKQLDESIKVLKKAVTKGHIPSYNELGISYRENKELDESIRVLEKAREITKESNLIVLNELGISYRENNQLDESIKVLEKAVAKDHIPSYNELGISYRENNQLDESIKVLEKAVAKDHIPSYNELGISYRESGNIDKAIKLLDANLAMSDAFVYNLMIIYLFFSPSAQSAEKYFKKLTLERQMRKVPNKFVENLENIWLINADQAVLKKYKYYLIFYKSFTKAIEFLEKYLKVFPNDCDIKEAFAKTLFSSSINRDADGFDILNELIEVYEGNKMPVEKNRVIIFCMHKLLNKGDFEQYNLLDKKYELELNSTTNYFILMARYFQLTKESAAKIMEAFEKAYSLCSNPSKERKECLEKYVCFLIVEDASKYELLISKLVKEGKTSYPKQFQYPVLNGKVYD
jgi:tetratricopeptide (TPR) repeat protein